MMLKSNRSLRLARPALRAVRLAMAAWAGRALVVPIAAIALAACSGDGGDAHGHGDDAATDVANGADAGVQDAGDTAVPIDATSDAVAETPPTCSPTCGTGFVCCTDAHGHNPTCAAGTSCP